MVIRRVTNEREWDAMITAQPHAQFLQLWAWGTFQESVGRSAIRYVVEAGGQWQAYAQVLVYTIRGRWQYWYIPRGPEFLHSLTDDTVVRVGRELIGKIESDARAAGAIFMTIEPPFLRDDEKLVRMMRVGHSCESTGFIQPQDTQLLDLSQPETTLLEGMHHKTRYNIRLAQRKGALVRRSTDVSDMKQFIRLTRDTAARDGITAHAPKYYEQMMATLGHGPLSLFVAEYQGQIIAANITILVGDTMTYVHGASGDTHRNIMAPHLLQWEQIRYAQSQGVRWYDFGGIGSDQAGTRQRWSGITRFKQGFGGMPVSYVGACNLILQPGWYTLYKIARRIKR